MQLLSIIAFVYLIPYYCLFGVGAAVRWLIGWPTRKLFGREPYSFAQYFTGEKGFSDRSGEALDRVTSLIVGMGFILLSIRILI